MPDKAWKAFERRIAKSLGTHRTPLSGGASRHTRSDTLHPHLYVECKYRTRLAVSDWYDEVDKLAVQEDKMPMLVLHKKRGHFDLVVLSMCNFLKLWEFYLDTALEYGWDIGQREWEAKE